MITTIIVSTIFLLKTGYKNVKLHIKKGNIVTISDDYHHIIQLLLLTIIADSKNLTISIIVKENITVNPFVATDSEQFCSV